MDSLPPEIKLKIFNQLSIRDSIKCRKICKEWLAIIDCLKYKSLNISVLSDEQCRINSYEREAYFLILNFKKFFRSVTIDPKFSRIKVMNGIGYLSKVENLDVFINHFQELEELNLFSAPEVVNFVLNLKFLKKIKFDQPCGKVKLETPSLTHLMTMEFSNFEICYPEQIKCLGVPNTSDITKCTNLEILIIIDYFDDESSISQLSADLLHQLPRLKRVYAGRRYSTKKIDQIPIERNSKLQVYYYGFRINSDSFGNFDWTNIKNSKEFDDERMYGNILIPNDGEWTSFLARNYSTSIDDNPYYFNLDYTRLQNEFDQNVPKDFFKKISKFYIIRIGNLDDEAKILNFLASTKPAEVLIENSTLSRSFLEQLSKFSSIGRLKIKIDEWPDFLDDFNFDFKNENINLIFEIHCSLKSFRPVFEVFERAKSHQFILRIFSDELNFDISNIFFDDLDSSKSSVWKLFSIGYTMNGIHISTCYIIESLDFCLYLDKQVPSIVELKDKLRLFFMIKEYETERRIVEKVIRKLCLNPSISIKF